MRTILVPIVVGLGGSLLMPVLLPTPAHMAWSETSVASPDVSAAGGTGTDIARAVSDSDLEEMHALLQLDSLFDVFRQEGMDHGADLETAMFPGRGGDTWQGRVAEIYGDPAVRQRFEDAFAQSLADSSLGAPGVAAEINGFLDSALGRKIMTQEVEARRILLDEAATEAAEVTAEKMQAERSPRLRLIRKVIEAGDMIEANVVGTMTGMMAFDEGLAQSAPARGSLPPEERVARLWSEEAQIRATTTNWLVTYMALAYEPLSDEELGAYAKFMASGAGQALNRALFAGYEAAFTPVMRELGVSAGRVMQGRNI